MKKIFALLLIISSFHLAAQNVGIGTTSPTEQLDVNGNLRVRGLSNASGQAASFMQVNADGILKLAKPDTLRANPTPASLSSVDVGNGSAHPSDYPSGVAVGGTKACVVNFSSSTLQLFDVSGTTPVLLGSAPTNTNPSDVAISGNKAFVISFGGLISLQIFDISGTTPTLSWRCPHRHCRLSGDCSE
jgi:hypothetical protein